MNSSPFRLLPWEHGGVTPAPSRVIEARVAGELWRFEVKWREGRAFFRLADSEDNRVWASWNGVGAHQIVSAIEASEIGRYFVVERGFSTQTVSAEFGAEIKARRGTYDLFGATSLAVIVTDRNQGRAQEWCGGPWLKFALPARAPIRGGAHKPSIWHRGWNVVGLNGALANLAGEVAFRPFNPDVAEDQQLAFANGSVEQLRRLYQAAHLIFAPVAIERQPWLRGYISGGGSQAVRAETAQNRAQPLENYVVPVPLLDAFVRHNLPVGGQWSRPRQPDDVAQTASKLSRFIARKSPRKSVVVTQRRDYLFDPHIVRFAFETPLDSSAHEQLEARLLLRDWMRETLPAAQFDRLKKYLAA